jgi:hypothetical protein
MKLAVMQPYFLPYLGYFQLMAAVDKFVVYDDVNFIKRGWINRNRILLNGQEHLFVIPLRRASQNQRINEVALARDRPWRQKLLTTFRHAYRRAPQFYEIFPVISEIVNYPEESLNEYLHNSLRRIKSFLGIGAEVVRSSAIYENRSLKGQERILDICRQEKASVYFNLSGGKQIYDQELFRANGITLRFLEPPQISYEQFGAPFLPSLSIVDVLMFNAVKKIQSEFLYGKH